MKMLMKGNSLGKSRKGFTLIELLIVMVILAILAGIVIISVGGVIGRGQESAYNADRNQIKLAVADYLAQMPEGGDPYGPGRVPVIDWNTSVNGTDWADSPLVVPGETYYLIGLCSITANADPKGLLSQLPNTAAAANYNASGANARAGVDAECLANANFGHYRWYTSANGNIASLCPGVGCVNTSQDGFQDIYP